MRDLAAYADPDVSAFEEQKKLIRGFTTPAPEAEHWSQRAIDKTGLGDGTVVDRERLEAERDKKFWDNVIGEQRADRVPQEERRAGAAGDRPFRAQPPKAGLA